MASSNFFDVAKRAPQLAKRAAFPLEAVFGREEDIWPWRARVAAEKECLVIAVGAGTTRLTNDACSLYTEDYAYDIMARARGTGRSGGEVALQW